jgi:hypothetical protein
LNERIPGMPPSVAAIEAIYRLRKSKSKQLVRFQGGMWAPPETLTQPGPTSTHVMVPIWGISQQSVIALEALGFLSPETNAEARIVSYRLTSKGIRGRVRI